jgi:hypothetical protein
VYSSVKQKADVKCNIKRGAISIVFIYQLHLGTQNAKECMGEVLVGITEGHM